jgi:hypothetical protein
MNDIIVHIQTILWIDMKITKHIDRINIKKIFNFTLIKPITITVVSSNPVHGKMYSIQHYVIKFVRDFRQIGGFLAVSATNKTNRHDITEILLKVALNTINQAK